MFWSEFDIVDRAANFDNLPDAFRRAYFASIYDNTLNEIHESLCHPEISGFYHFCTNEKFAQFNGSHTHSGKSMQNMFKN